MTIYHYAEAGTLAACGQLVDGADHTTCTADLLRGYSRLTPARVCPTCLAVASEQTVHAIRESADGATETAPAGATSADVLRELEGLRQDLAGLHDAVRRVAGLVLAVDEQVESLGHGLSQLEDEAVTLDEARGVASAIATLLDDVERVTPPQSSQDSSYALIGEVTFYEGDDRATRWDATGEIELPRHGGGTDEGRIMVRFDVDGLTDVIYADGLGRSGDLAGLDRAITTMQKVRAGLAELYDGRQGPSQCWEQGVWGRCREGLGHDGDHEFPAPPETAR